MAFDSFTHYHGNRYATPTSYSYKMETKDCDFCVLALLSKFYLLIENLHSKLMYLKYF